MTSDAATDKNISKKTLIYSSTSLKNSSLDLNSFLEGTPKELSKIIRQCLTKEDPNDWGVRRYYIPILADIFETHLASAKKPKEGIYIKALEDIILVIKTTHINSLAINPEDQDT